MDELWTLCYQNNEKFCVQDFSNILEEKGYHYSIETLRKGLKKAVEEEKLIKEGRDIYSIPKEKKYYYKPEYSEYAYEIAGIIQESYPYLDFSLFELRQLNEFVNHQIAHNTIFVFAESEVISFVFETLKDKFPGKVLFNPTLDLYDRYWCDNLIVVKKLVGQRPMSKEVHWHTRIETVLVDLFADSLLKNIVAESEFPSILDAVFHRYILNENSLFRYAKRRNADQKIRKTISEKTDIVLGIKD